MSNTIFFHNLTKQVVNMVEFEAVAETYTEGDTIMYTRSGNAILYPIDSFQLQSIKDHILYNKKWDEDSEDLQIKQS